MVYKVFREIVIWIFLFKRPLPSTGELEFGGQVALELGDSQVALQGGDTCGQADKLGQALKKNITTLREFLKDEIDKRLGTITDSLMDILEEHELCLHEVEQSSKCLDSETTGIELSTTRKSTCVSSHCQHLVSRMLNMMNHKVDPCQDFYEFACGGLISDSTLQPQDPKDEVANRIKAQLSQMDASLPLGIAKTFYSSCLSWAQFPPKHTSALTAARAAVHQIGHFIPPEINETSTRSTPPNLNVQDFLREFFKRDFSPFISVGIEEIRDGDFHIKLSLPVGDNAELQKRTEDVVCYNNFLKEVQKAKNEEHKLDLEFLYEEYKRCYHEESGLEARLNLMVEAAEEIGVADEVPEEDRKELFKNTKTNVELLLRDIYSAMATKPDILLALNRKEYENITLSKFQEIVKNEIDWKSLLSDITALELKDDLVINLYHKHEIQAIFNVLNTEWLFNQESTYNALLLLWVEESYRRLVLPTFLRSSTQHEEFCIGALKSLMPDMASQIYLQSFKPEQIIDLIEFAKTKANNIQSTLNLVVRKNPMSSDDLKTKVKNIDFTVADFMHLENLTNFKHYEQMNSLTNYATNFQALKSNRPRMVYQLLGPNEEKSSKYFYYPLPFDTKSNFIHERNLVFFPLGLFAPPYLYDSSLPEYITYGSLAHEMTTALLQALDSTGIKYGSKSGFLDIPESYVNTSECIGNQLQQKFHLQYKNVQANIMLTKDLKLDSFMVSSGATRLSWLAYRRQLNPEVNDPLSVSSYSNEEDLIWLGPKPLLAAEAYFLRVAQTQCETENRINLVSMQESNLLPARIRVNLMLQNEPLFATTFHCPKGSEMNLENQCPFDLTI